MTTLMTARVLSAPSTFSFVSVPRPDPVALAPGRALVRVVAGGICGTDLPYFRGAALPPFVDGTVAPVGYPMHEILAEVVCAHPEPAAGTEPGEPLRPGTRVVGWATIDRSDVAAHFGIDELVWSGSDQWAADLDPHLRPHVVIEAVGHQPSTLQDALTAVAPSGTVFYFGVNDDRCYPLDMDSMLRKHLTLMSGGTLDRPRMLREAGAYLRRYPDLLIHTITHRYPRAEAQRAYETAQTPSVGRLKVVIAH